MNDADIILYGSKGTTQQERFLTHIGTDDLEIDNSSLMDDLALAADLSGEYLYYNFLNKVEGTWEPFFRHNYLFALANVAIKKVGPDAAIRSITARLGHEPNAQLSKSQVSLSKQLFSFAVGLINQIDSWHQLFSDNLNSAHFHTEITIVCRKYDVADLLSTLKRYLFYLKQNNLLIGEDWRFSSFDLEAFKGAIWQKETQAATVENDVALPALVADIKSGLVRVQQACDYLKKLATDLFKKELNKSADCSPHTAMFITFCQLHTNARAMMNQYAKKHIDYYYRTILQQTAKKASPDSVYLSFTLNDKISELLMPAGTLLDGKASDGTTLQFITDEALMVNSGVLAGLTALYIDNGGVGTINDFADGVPNIVTGVYTSIFSESHSLNAVADGWPILSSCQTPASALEPAVLGFAVSSPVLLMREGGRTLTVVFTFGPSPNGLKTSPGTPLAQNMGFFKKTLIFKITIATGWMEIFPSELSYDMCTTQLTAVFNWTLLDPAIDNYQQSKHGGNYDVACPILTGMLNNCAFGFVYNLFTNFELIDVSLKADVKGLNDIIIYNSNNSRVPPTKPFQPFGAVPVTDAGVVIGSNETASKNLTSVSLNLQWSNLPYQGFYLYYKAYDNDLHLSEIKQPPPINNTTFKADISILCNDVWMADKSSTSSLSGLDLFKSVDGELGLLEDDRTFVIDILGLSIPPVVSALTPTGSVNYTGAINGFYKISLTKPKFAFGHSLYPIVLAEVLTKNAQILIDDAPNKQSFLNVKSKQDTAVLQSLPNAPYTPSIKQLTIDYTAIDSLSGTWSGQSSPSGVTLFHINPFSTYKIDREWSGALCAVYPSETAGDYQEVSSPFLVPTYNQSAYLYINLTGIVPLASVNLLVHIFPNAMTRASNGSIAKQLVWEYLASDNWTAFDSLYSPQDQTGGLLNTGIIKITLPLDSTSINTVMPAGYWIRVSTSDTDQVFGSLAAVYLHAIKATRNIVSPYSLSDIGHLIPGTITKFNKQVPQIKIVTQPLPSSGGRNAEDEKQFYTRVGERLRHKQRAITPWDYEHIILEQFPWLYFVRCLSHTAYSLTGSYNAPGKVLVMVIPNVNDPADATKYTPRLASADLLVIKNYITGLASPFASIDVVNPTYIYVQVECVVNKVDSGDKNINQLKGLIDSQLAPWLRNGNMEGNLDLGVLRSSLFNSVNNTGFIDLNSGLSLNLLTIDANGSIQKLAEDAITFQPWCVFTTFGDHDIKVNNDAGIVPAAPLGVGNTVIGKNFYVSNQNGDASQAVTPANEPITPGQGVPFAPIQDDPEDMGFSEAYQITMQNEGGYADNVHDNGGETWKGVARNKWPRWPGWGIVDTIKTGNPEAAREALDGHPGSLNQALYASATLETYVQSFYRVNFWDDILLGKLSDQQIADQLFDTAVNMGTGMACWFLKKAIHLFIGGAVTDDFAMDSETILSANKLDAESLYNQIISERRIFYESLIKSDPDKYERFRNSWMSRITPYRKGG